MSNKGRIILSSQMVTDGIFMLQGASILWSRVTPAGDLEVCLEHPDMPEVDDQGGLVPLVTITYTNVMGMVRRDGMFLNPAQDVATEHYCLHHDCTCVDPEDEIESHSVQAYDEPDFNDPEETKALRRRLSELT